MTSSRDLLRAVRTYQRPLHDPNATFATTRTLVIDGVVLKIQTNTLIITEEDTAAKNELASTLSIFEPG